VDLQTGVLLIPGVFIGGILGGMMARQLNARRMAGSIRGADVFCWEVGKSFPHGRGMDAYYVDMVDLHCHILPGIDDGGPNNRGFIGGWRKTPSRTESPVWFATPSREHRISIRLQKRLRAARG